MTDPASPAPAGPEPTAEDLRDRLGSLGPADRRRLGSLLDRVGRPGRGRARRGRGRRGRSGRDDGPVTLARVADEVAAAEARLARRRERLPVPTYPPELPITERREELLAAIRDHQVVVVAGETGSGKSTQLPKLCLELGRGVLGMVGHTQPRRVAARTIAERVAEELGAEVGGAVGYAVRFTDRVGDDTHVKVMTDGILLAEMRRDRDLTAYDTLIVDEAHERSLNIDFLLGYLHQLLPRRPDLKVIITSATIDTERFASHFHDAPVVEVSGRTFPVEVRYRPFGEPVVAEEGDDVVDDDRDQVEAVCDAVDELLADTTGDVLVFLSGEREIRDTADALADRDRPGLEVLPLYARLSSAEQHRVFEPHRGRRVVLATNVAETSLTVPGVRSVVDAGTARVSRYSHRLKVQRLPIEKISRASADQRAGRCGRVAPGTCIRLYSEEDLEARPEFTDPEILRTNLASVILQMTDLGLGEVAAFPFLDPPDARAVRDGVALLEELGAVEQGRSGRRLTEVGRRLVRLPIDPRLGRMVLESERRGCVREVLVIASALSLQDPRERPADRRQEADELHARFRVPGSDLLAFLALWDHLEDRRRALGSSAFRREVRSEHLNFLRIREWRDLHRQLARAAASVGIRPGEEAASPDQVHRALLAGLLSQVGMRDRDTRDIRGARGARFQVAPGSVLARRPPAWLMAAELVETNRLWARGVAAIEPGWVEDLAGHLVKRSHGDPRWDARSGRAVTTERVTLYGLPLVTDRTVGYDRVDRDEARDLFVDHALVRREWETHHGFLDENEATLDAARALGDRLRRDDLFDHDQALFRFYDARVGDEVVSGRHFDRWWKEVRRDDPGRLTLTVDDILHEDDVDLSAYPDTWHQGDLALAVTYRYAPGEVDDGATVHIPLALLNRVEPWDLDWGIPAYRRELVHALVASLPKARRRELGPLAAAASAAADALTFEERPLVEVLAERLSAHAGAPVRADDLDVTRVPDHLRLTFSVEDGDEVVAHGTDLLALKELVGARARRALAEAVADAAPGLERTGLTRWDLGDLPRVVRSEVDGQVVEGYPALLDDEDSVSVRVFSRPEVADRVMAGGLRRLVLLTVPVGVRGLGREVGGGVALALAALPELGLGALLRDVIAAAASTVVARHGGPTWTEEGVTALLAAARAELRATASDALADAGRVVVAAAEVASALDRLGAPSLAPSVDDARAHLGRLVRPGFVATAGTARLPDVVRYVRGIGVRLEKVPEEPGRDRARMAEVLPVERDYRQLLGALTPSQVTRRVVEAGWGLEELRLATFAQTVGARGKVSPTRMAREIDALWSGDLD
ncbi:ATP-dependent RNA helicase HrpA [Iamia majanohamensis]|uniref:ATP-dependent RNA helicase HrpA n=1 Tax=Iamia majanohamensis TaxID=467976 RepID=A0AAF0BU64_9ACTN|nr:ATP-dependent RNA helicase HrpA [Iamia majanohamensis]WCO65738.1 ATP-dependent RNA helicase HrpA [Iamia majanohamensis]